MVRQIGSNNGMNQHTPALVSPSKDGSEAKASSTNAPDPVLEVSDLQTVFGQGEGAVRAVDGISFSIGVGRTLGLVGESGSGKSVTSLSVMGLLPAPAGQIAGGEVSFVGKDLVRLPPAEFRRLRGRDLSMIFQEPGTALNPVYRVGNQVAEALRLHRKMSKAEARRETIRLFEEVGIDDAARRIDSYPHELSGGQKQRVMIAMAMSCQPKLLIADEPTTALDVTIQAQILDLLRQLRDERGMAILFITHDLGVVAQIADDVAVMHKGRLVECKPVLELFRNPEHPYTRGLLACRPKLEGNPRRLPTVADHMARIEAGEPARKPDSLAPAGTWADDDSVDKETPDPRVRLLHPAAELRALGYEETPAVEAGERVRLVDAGVTPVLDVQDLAVWYPIRQGLLGRAKNHVKAVDGISFRAYRGQTIGLVGESGCGKTTTGRAILRLVKKTAGTVLFENKDLHSLSREEMRAMRRKIQVVFQDPYGSLNPRMTIESTITEPMVIHQLESDRGGRRERAVRLLEEVGLDETALARYPHEFSGGQRQRIGIARALAVEPEFIICDESVSALDVSVQAQVLNLLLDLQQERNLTYIFISHDLSVVKFMSDMVAVMKGGKIVEFGPGEEVYRRPKDPYTQRLIASIPNASLSSIEQRVAKRG